jgi:branched-chain amino acid transport system ATP-binding protein
MPLLELRNVSTYYGNVQALKSVSLHVEEGEVVALLGANGAGKSTTLKTISGLLHPKEGSISFGGRDITTLKPEAIVRLGAAQVPEGRHIFPGLTVSENMLLGASNRTGISRGEMEADVQRMFKIFPELTPFADALGWTLSGGQQQMLAVARGLMSHPRLLLLDEPSLGLAPLIVQQVFRVIADIRARGTTVLLVEQNANMALSVADRGYVLETGSLKTEGRASELLNNEEVRAAYLGGHARKRA